MDAPVVVVAIDEHTYNTAPFAGLPKVMWTPQIANVQDSILDAGAKVIGWDVILPTSAATYVADRDFDRSLLQSLSRTAREGRVVLGMADVGAKPIKPHVLFTWAVGGDKNLRLINILPDDDGVVRHVPVAFKAGAGHEDYSLINSFSREVAERYLGKHYSPMENGGLGLLGKPVRGVRNNAVLLNFDQAATAIPTYSVADLHACAEAGNAEFFRTHFSGKIVLLGLVLDIEDRKLSSARLFTDGGPLGPVEGCVTPENTLRHPANDRSTLPGVYLHAVAIHNLVHESGLEILAGPYRYVPMLLMAAFAALSAIFLRLPVTIVLVASGAVLWTLATFIAFELNYALPLLAPLLAGFVTLTGVFALRFAFIDRDARFLRRAFSSYISPALVEELVRQPDMLKLSGERREMTFLFTDLAGFTGLIEKQTPEDSVNLLNEYLAEMVDIAKLHGGTLDKVVGDALHIIFSAPLDQQDHAQRAVDCALAMDRFASNFSARHKALGIPFGETRIGVNTGIAIIGNFGGKEFFDYTAHGDAINTAARLESANKQFGTRLAVSGTTASQCKNFNGRPIGNLVLKGKTEATEVLEPISDRGTQKDLFDEYNRAFELMAQRSRKATRAFGALARKFPDDGLTRFHLARLKAGETGSRVVLSTK